MQSKEYTADCKSFEVEKFCGCINSLETFRGSLIKLIFKNAIKLMRVNNIR